jgi:hypothetical protein
MVEHYRKEKKMRIFILEKLHYEYLEKQHKLNRKDYSFKSDPYKGGLSFQSFKNMIDVFDPSIPQLVIASIYRNAWVSGNGVVSFDSFIIAANE